MTHHSIAFAFLEKAVLNNILDLEHTRFSCPCSTIKPTDVVMGMQAAHKHHISNDDTSCNSSLWNPWCTPS
jgi:hypothetical protein